jgi:hypothetical protein
MRKQMTERGASLIGAILLVVILSMLATVSLSLAVQELESDRAARDEAVARHLAEAGAGLVLRWFHDPSSAPTGAVRSLLDRRHELPERGPSFFDAAGRSQFTGTEDRPDIVFNAARPVDDQLLNDPSGGWFRSVSALGRIQSLKVYGPTRPGLLCTVQVTALAHGLARTLSVQLGEQGLPPLRAAVEIGGLGPAPAADTPLPVWVHWGDLVVNGNVQLGAVRDLPVNTWLAPVTGQSYAEQIHLEDRWLDVFVGGEARFIPPPPDPVPAHVHVRQEPTPGLPRSRWDYETMKREALRDGTYYARGQDGLLYRHGTIEPGLGVTVDEALRSAAVGDQRGLVFVDTLDQTPPRADNLGTITLRTDYAEGIFVLNAHVAFSPGGAGKSVPALSPPPDGAPAEARIPAQLAGIHLRGVLVTPGDVTLEGRPRVHGAVVVGGNIVQAAGSISRLEVWYDDELRRGLIRGIPLVYEAPGTWLEKYGERKG